MAHAMMNSVNNLVHTDRPEQWFEKVVPNHRQHTEDHAEDNTQPHLWPVQSVPGHTCKQGVRRGKAEPEPRGRRLLART